MIKQLVIYFLSICILLFSGSNQIFGKTSKQGELSIASYVENTNLVNPQFNHSSFFKTPFSTNNGNGKSILAENEVVDDDLLALKKHLKNNSFFIAVILSLVFVSLLLSINKKLSVFNRLSGLVSDKKYLMVRAIRV